jgi:hypothetical protein
MSDPNKTSALRSRPELYITGMSPIDPTPDAECSICTEALEADVVQIAVCQHAFHCRCIVVWLEGNERGNRTCPNYKT